MKKTNLPAKRLPINVDRVRVLTTLANEQLDQVGGGTPLQETVGTPCKSMGPTCPPTL